MMETIKSSLTAVLPDGNIPVWLILCDHLNSGPMELSLEVK